MRISGGHAAAHAPMCADCGAAHADVVCCGTPLCLLHARCTQHAGHAAKWRAVRDLEAAERSLAGVHAALTRELVDELEVAQAALDSRAAREAAASRGVRASASGSTATAAAIAALRHAAAPPGPLTGQAFPKPALPTFDSIRRRAMEAAHAAPRAAPDGGGGIRDGGEGATSPAAVAAASPVPAPPARPIAALPAGLARAPSGDSVDAAFRNTHAQLGSGRAAIVVALSRALERGRDADVAAAGAAGGMAAGRAAAAIDESNVMASATAAAVAALAEGIEGAVWEAAGSDPTPAYRDQVRLLVAALSDARAGELRARVVGGELPPHHLARMDRAALEPESARSFRVRVLAHEARPLASSAWTPCGAACPACGATGAEYTMAATAADSRKAEIWGTSSSSVDTRAYRMRCATCAHEWATDAVPPPPPPPR